MSTETSSTAVSCAERLAEIADADGRPRGQRFGGFEPGERAGHGWSLEASICRAKPSFTTDYFATIVAPDGGSRPHTESTGRRKSESGLADARKLAQIAPSWGPRTKASASARVAAERGGGTLMNAKKTSPRAPARPRRAPGRRLDREFVDDLVAAYRTLASLNVLDAFGHVSVRDPRNPNRYLMARSVAPEIRDGGRYPRPRSRQSDRRCQGRGQSCCTANASSTARSTRSARMSMRSCTATRPPWFRLP